jgi:hypothetical protein
MLNEVKCERCGGSGSQVWDEDGRPVKDVCYRCSGSGRVTPEDAHQVRLQAACEVLAGIAVEARRKAYNEDPEGEDWAFAAAENMMSERDYTTARRMEFADKFGPELAGLSQALQEALIKALS